jgi:hypothetical protein
MAREWEGDLDALYSQNFVRTLNSNVTTNTGQTSGNKNYDYIEPDQEIADGFRKYLQGQLDENPDFANTNGVQYTQLLAMIAAYEGNDVVIDDDNPADLKYIVNPEPDTTGTGLASATTTETTLGDWASGQEDIYVAPEVTPIATTDITTEDTKTLATGAAEESYDAWQEYGIPVYEEWSRQMMDILPAQSQYIQDFTNAQIDLLGERTATEILGQETQRGFFDQALTGYDPQTYMDIAGSEAAQQTADQIEASRRDMAARGYAPDAGTYAEQERLNALESGKIVSGAINQALLDTEQRNFENLGLAAQTAAQSGAFQTATPTGLEQVTDPTQMALGTMGLSQDQWQAALEDATQRFGIEVGAETDYYTANQAYDLGLAQIGADVQRTEAQYPTTTAMDALSQALGQSIGAGTLGTYTSPTSSTDTTQTLAPVETITNTVPGLYPEG